MQQVIKYLRLGKCWNKSKVLTVFMIQLGLATFGAYLFLIFTEYYYIYLARDLYWSLINAY